MYETNLYLDALSEMKIVYLSKSLEIYLKTLIKTAYPEIDTKPFYLFDKMISFFKSKSIEIDKLKGFIEFSELRKVNNSIKHSSLLSEEVKKISEFKGKSEHNSLSLDLFHDRVKPKIELFKEDIAEEIIKELFEFNNERLVNLVKVFSNRMNVGSFRNFSKKIFEELKTKNH